MSTPATSRFARFRDDLYNRSFSPSSDDTRSVGAEVELLVYDSDSKRPIPLLGPRSLISALRRRRVALGVIEVPADGPVPHFEIPGRAALSFEPGGQLEISTIAHNSGSGLAAAMRDIVRRFRDVLALDGLHLASIGIDPFNDARSIPQQLPVERYRKLTAYLEHIGPFGIRMMRQTAAIQVSIDRGLRPTDRWRLLNDLAPYLTAIFANSPCYDGSDTGHQSYRAHCWRMLDPTRTGLHASTGSPADVYTRFALGANDMLRSDSAGGYRPFGEWETDDNTVARWATHLTTLFPEVRPRGHFEVRSCDAIDPDWYVVPVLLISALAYDARASREAGLLASESGMLLRIAGERGLRDSAIARTARDLFQLALQGARRLGPSYFSEADLDRSSAFYDRYTGRDRSPADDWGSATEPAQNRLAAPAH